MNFIYATTTTDERAPLANLLPKLETKDSDYSPKELPHFTATSQSTTSSSRTQGAPKAHRAQKKAEEGAKEEMEENLTPASGFSEVVARNFVRECHERSLVRAGERELAISKGVAIQVDPAPVPTFSPEELLGSITSYRATRAGKRRL